LPGCELVEINGAKVRVAWLSVASNTTLTLLKLAVGFMIGSVSVMSEAIHSGVDLLAAVIALGAVTVSGKPADEDHPFGHGKFENVSGVVEALLIFVAAAWIVFESIRKLVSPHEIANPSWGIAVMAVSAAANIVVSQMLFRIGRRTDSMALLADGWHLRTDVYTSVGVMVGLGLLRLGGVFWPEMDLRWLDPVVALGVAALILKAAWDLTRQSGRDLFDVSLPTEEEAVIREAISAQMPEVRGFHHLRTRKAGAHRYIEFHMMVDAAMHVSEAHELTDRVGAALREHLAGAYVTIHVEPCGVNCSPHCQAGCMLPENERPGLEEVTAENAGV